jgi:hypothetical protein
LAGVLAGDGGDTGAVATGKLGVLLASVLLCALAD